MKSEYRDCPRKEAEDLVLKVMVPDRLFNADLKLEVVIE
jgi:hypothetical protein